MRREGGTYNGVVIQGGRRSVLYDVRVLDYLTCIWFNVAEGMGGRNLRGRIRRCGWT